VHGVVQQAFGVQLDSPSINASDVFGHPRSAAEIDEQIALWVRQTSEDIETLSIDDYLPMSIERVGGRLVRLSQGCPEQVLAGPLDPEAGATRIFSLDMKDVGSALESLAVLGFADGFYLDSESLILHQNVYGTAADPLATLTNVHRFDVSGTRVQLAASGSPSGVLASGSSISQDGGVIRMLVGESALVSVEGPDGVFETFGTAQSLVTLGARDGQLAELARLPVSGYEQYLQSCRFEGDWAYVSLGTSVAPGSQVVVLDLAEPTSPRSAGQLAVPGDVSLLLPLSERLLLGVGQRDSRSEGSSFALRALDVSEPSAPRLLAEYVSAELEYTDAVYDPRMLAVHPDRDVIALHPRAPTRTVARWACFGWTLMPASRRSAGSRPRSRSSRSSSAWPCSDTTPTSWPRTPCCASCCSRSAVTTPGRGPSAHCCGQTPCTGSATPTWPPTPSMPSRGLRSRRSSSTGAERCRSRHSRPSREPESRCPNSRRAGASERVSSARPRRAGTPQSSPNPCSPRARRQRPVSAAAERKPSPRGCAQLGKTGSIRGRGRIESGRQSAADPRM